MRRSVPRPGDAGTRQVLDTVLRRSPAQPAFRWRASRRLAVLAYHGIDDAEGFERHLDHLRRTASPVSLEDVLDAIARRRGLPRRAVLITFDDGHRSVLDVATPMLVERGMPAAVFVVAGLLDTDAPVWTTEAAELVAVAPGSARAPQTVALVRELKRLPDTERVARMDELRRASGRPAPSIRQLGRADLPVLESAGVAIGNHSLTHPCLSRCTAEKIESEVRAAHEILADATGAPPRAFAYPDGDRDPRVRGVVATIGYEAAFLFDHRLSPVPPADPLAISRLRVNPSSGLDRLEILLSGLHPAVHRLRGGS